MKAVNLVGHIVEYSNQIHSLVTNLRLQPLLYYINEKSLCKLGEPAFEDKYEEWKFGKVLADVYYEFSMWASLPLINVKKNPEVPEETVKIIQEVVNELALIPTWKLIDKMRKDCNI